MSKSELGEWIVDIKGTHDKSPEISVVRKNNAHGQQSYGWEGTYKIIIFGSGGPCRYELPNEVFEMHKETAEKYAKMLNQQEIEER